MSVEKIISEIKLKRENIASILNEFKAVFNKNKILRLEEFLKSPVHLFIEVILVTVISIILLPFIYNFIFIVPLSPLTFTIYLMVIVFIIVIPFNLILNRLCSHIKSKYFKNSALKSALAELTKLETEFLKAVFKSKIIENKPKKLDILTEIELNESALKTSLSYNAYTIFKDEEIAKIEIIDFHKNISGRYLLYEENLKNQYGELELIVDNNIIWKKSAIEEGKMRLIPAQRQLTKLLFNFKNISLIKRVEFIVEKNNMRIIVYEPTPLSEEWLSARIPETIESFRNLALNLGLKIHS
ncbi:MAG: hypothetical protein OdinLCB4_000515 [Candidatus Odinarchaeum yellowstonii]|uniref:Uncharacterized protein n=1 Tax=Odinarchaeota yellowstonii (strain LCB_4) TaxID=1841599 RepID=A0AAF0IBJ6_ODILC|nr:MAG: hypothetical protein OdinLCB4_000515 [Candidatus Odinarchaeum yellowstonii]